MAPIRGGIQSQVLLAPSFFYNCFLPREPSGTGHCLGQAQTHFCGYRTGDTPEQRWLRLWSVLSSTLAPGLISVCFPGKGSPTLGHGAAMAWPWPSHVQGRPRSSVILMEHLLHIPLPFPRSEGPQGAELGQTENQLQPGRLC